MNATQPTWAEFATAIVDAFSKVNPFAERVELSIEAVTEWAEGGYIQSNYPNAVTIMLRTHVLNSTHSDAVLAVLYSL